MKEIMSWKQCLEDHIKKVNPDNGKINSMIRMCNIRLNVLKQIKIDKETAPV